MAFESATRGVVWYLKNFLKVVMVMAKDIFQRVADEARPPAVLGRYPGMPDYFAEVLLDDLVESGAWLDLELKRPFLALWVNDEDFDNTDSWREPIIGRTQKNVRKFAAMNPVVDLESLRGMKVKLVYNDEQQNQKI